MAELKEEKEHGAAYINYTARAWSTAADGIIAHAGQVRDVKRNKRQSEINEELYGIIGQGISGVYKYKGTKTNISEVTALTGVKQGDVWNVANEFDLNDKHYPAGTNVAATQDSSSASSAIWDPLGGSVNLRPLEEKIGCLNNVVIPKVDGIVADATIKDMGLLDATKIVYITAKKRFAAEKNGGLTGNEYYSTWTGSSVLPPDSYQEGLNPIKTKPYIVGKDIYVFDESGNFAKIKTGGGGEVIDSTTDTTSTNKALSARATHVVAMEAALTRQGKEVTDIARAEKGAKIEMSGYNGSERHQPFQLVFVYEPADGGYGANSLCAFIGGKYYNIGGMSEESENVIKQGNFLRTPDGSIYTQAIMDNPCIFDASKYVAKTSFTQLENEVNKLKALLKMS